MSYRLVVCIDVDAASLRDAYGKVCQVMMDTILEWDSSDEAFDPVDELITPEELSVARTSYLFPIEREAQATKKCDDDGEDRCRHGMFYTGVGACPMCGN